MKRINREAGPANPDRRRFIKLAGVGAGALALNATAIATAPSPRVRLSGGVRHYYLAAEEQLWDFAPTGIDQITGNRVPAPWTRYTRWPKVRYIEYTDDTFTERKPQPPWLGVLGPMIRAEVGDTVFIHFWNRSSIPCSVHPHGFHYVKDSEGALYRPAGAGASIAPGGRFTYDWFADEDSAPGPNDTSSLVWWYHSHVDEPMEVNAGLLGPIVITGAGMANPDGSPIDVDREFVLMFMIFDEDDEKERGLMHAINGFTFGNLPGLEMNSGERVRWYLLGMGNELDLHTCHWHGKTLLCRGHRTDVIELLPGSMATADMKADNPSTWIIHCHVADHIHAGMSARYTIMP